MTLTPRAWRALFLLFIGVSAYLLLSPQPPDPTPSAPGFDKAKHAILFGALALVGNRAFAQRPAYVLFLALAAYAALTELAQAFIPGRSAEWLDLVADGVGASLAFARK